MFSVVLKHEHWDTDPEYESHWPYPSSSLFIVASLTLDRFSDGIYFEKLYGKRLEGATLKSIPAARSQLDCLGECVARAECSSANYSPMDKYCELYDYTDTKAQQVTESEDWVHSGITRGNTTLVCENIVT